MKKRNYKLHVVYLFCIAILAVSCMALFIRMRSERVQMQERVDTAKLLDRERLVSSIEQAENALRMAAYSESPTVYAVKMQQLSEAVASAALLTEQIDPASVWGMFWKRLSVFAEQEIRAAIDQTHLAPNDALLISYADTLAKLKTQPEALEGALWADLPTGLKMPDLQTEFSLGEEELKSAAAKRLNIGSELLKKVEAGLPGIVRYRCANAEIDLLISGQLVYLDLQLPPKSGHIGLDEGIRRLTAFAEEEGYGETEVFDLYENEGILWAKMAPTVELGRLGAVKDLDRPLIAACTLWSGRVCHFEADISESREVSYTSEALLSEKRMKRLAEQKNAVIGESVICKGRICRTLILNRAADGRSVHLYLDATDGSECELAIRNSPLPEDLPASIDCETDRIPIGQGVLPPYDEWQRRRYRAASLGAFGDDCRAT